MLPHDVTITPTHCINMGGCTCVCVCVFACVRVHVRVCVCVCVCLKVVYNGKELNHPFGISHHRDSIFWTEYMNASVFQLDLASGDVTLLRSERPPLFGLRVYDAPSQQGPGADASFSRSDVFVSLFLCFSFLCACLWLSFHLRTFVSLFIYSMMC